MKLCECGCGQPAPIAKVTNRRRGHVAGQPVRFVSGHQHRRGPEYLVDPDTDCWVWQRALGSNGYGNTWFEGRAWLAHRLAWSRAHGEIPDGLELDHRCRNRACVNPDHLRLVTRAQNCQHRAFTGNRNSESGIRGVTRDGKRWRARQMLDGEMFDLGLFDTKGKAGEAAAAWRREHMPFSSADREGVT